MKYNNLLYKGYGTENHSVINKYGERITTIGTAVTFCMFSKTSVFHTTAAFNIMP
jgi:hypothetical protein